MGVPQELAGSKWKICSWRWCWENHRKTQGPLRLTSPIHLSNAPPRIAECPGDANAALRQCCPLFILYYLYFHGAKKHIPVPAFDHGSMFFQALQWPNTRQYALNKNPKTATETTDFKAKLSCPALLSASEGQSGDKNTGKPAFDLLIRSRPQEKVWALAFGHLAYCCILMYIVHPFAGTGISQWKYGWIVETNPGYNA